MPPDERPEHRLLTVKPLVDAYFAWVKQNVGRVLPKSETGDDHDTSICEALLPWSDHSLTIAENLKNPEFPLPLITSGFSFARLCTRYEPVA